MTSSTLYSAANVALPVVFNRPSTRLKGWPMAPGFTTLGLISHLLHSPTFQHAHRRALGEFDLECIVLVATCHFEFFRRCRFEGVFTRWRADENFSAAKARQGLCATPPNARRACLIVPSSTASAAATETSAKA